MTCPCCGGAPRAWRVYKHRWWVCARCGNAVSELRASLPHDRLPAGVRAWVPGSLRVDPARAADPTLQWFTADTYRSGSAAGTPYAAEVAKVDALLARFGLAGARDVLDLSGGPGFVAQALAARGARVVMTDAVRHVVQFAREQLGVDARVFDYQGAPLGTVVDGPFDLVMCRYSINHCLDPEAFARALAPLTRPGAHLLVAGFLSPSRGACLTSALEDGPPRVLWSPDWLAARLVAGGWDEVGRFETDPPMAYWAPRSWRYRLFSLPWELRPGPLPHDVHQHHPGILLRRSAVGAGP